MQRICLVAFVGLPASGKTTICNYLMEMDDVSYNILHFRYDDYIQFNLNDPRQYKAQREKLLHSLSKIINDFKISNIFPTEQISLKNHYKNNHSEDLIILCDDNHYYHSMRYKLYQLAREFSIGYCQIFFESTLELSLKYNSLRSDLAKVPNNVIVEMSKRLEIPNASVNKWEENTFVLKCSNLDRNICHDILSYIIQFLDVQILPLKFPSKAITQQSIVHDLDLLMRKKIGTIMSFNQQSDKKLLAKNLNDKRKDILKQFEINVSNQLQEDVDLNKYLEMLN